MNRPREDQRARGRRALIQFNRAQVLEALATGKSLVQVLTILVKAFEASVPGSVGAVWLLDRIDQVLRLGAGPALPKSLRRAVERSSGKAGAESLRRRRFLLDPSTAFEEAGLKKAAARAGLCCSWSAPIVASTGEPLGTLALYHRRPSTPQKSDREFLGAAAHLFALAIELKYSEAAVLESESRLRQILDLVPHMIFAKDEQGRFILVNRALADAYSTTVDQLVHRKQAEVHEVDHELRFFLEGDQEVIESQRPKFVSEHAFTDARGRVRLLQTIKIPYRDSGRAGGAILGVAVDITERKKVEEELHRVHGELERRVRERTAALRSANQKLRATQARLHHLISTNPAVIYTSKSEVDFGLTFMSENVRRMTGYDPKAFLKESRFWFDHIHPDDRAQVFSTLNRMLVHDLHTHEYRFRHKDGHYLWIRDELSMVRARRGQELKIVGFWTDVTARKQAEDELHRTQDKVQRLQAELASASRLSVLSEMAAALAHELNQPLVAISHYSGACRRLLKSQKPDPSKVVDYLSFVEQEAVRGGDIIRHLLSYVHKRAAARSTLNINEVIRETLPLLQLEARRAGVELSLALDDSLPTLCADRVQIQQVVVNIIRNAIEALSTSNQPVRRVKLETAGDGERVRIEFTDTGPGLPADDPEKVFQRFYTTKPTGMGLGLSLSRFLVEANGGTLRARNQEHGAVFTVTLPVSGSSGDHREPGLKARAEPAPQPSSPRAS